ncbi:MAG TPA: hypothetical protein VFZ09_51510 [Archangium sp.]|uniref:hypothetical protein n=1 Tax=Archangium sp. TaxID=1872627 RepID=UPI002E328C31|nr:hypothetical protein [Archangium sp.]HEX5754717.1 hypothetical protein [Archangium sp.]
MAQQLGDEAQQAGGEAEKACARCQALQREVRELREARDRALEDLARAREEVNTLRLLRAQQGEPPPAAPAEPESLPLRYVLVDQLNLQLKRRLGPLHVGTRRLIRLVKGGGDS